MHSTYNPPLSTIQAYKLGLDRPSIREQVWETYRLENGLEEQPEPGSSLAFEHTPEERAAIESTLKAARNTLKEAEDRDRLWEHSTQQVKKSIRSGSGQTIGTATHGVFGLALGVAIIQGTGLLMKQLGRLRKGKAGKGKGKPKGAATREGQPPVRPPKTITTKPTASTTPSTTATAASPSTQQAEATKARARATTTRKR